MMTEREMNRRLNQMNDDQRCKVRRLIREGYGAEGIKRETGLPVRLINAVFQQVDIDHHPDMGDFNCVSSPHHY